MGPRLTAACVLTAVGVIVGSIVYSMAMLFALSPLWGLLGVVAFAHGVALTHYVGVGR